jgi:hypothetical protein
VLRAAIVGIPSFFVQTGWPRSCAQYWQTCTDGLTRRCSTDELLASWRLWSPVISAASALTPETYSRAGGVLRPIPVRDLPMRSARRSAARVGRPGHLPGAAARGTQTKRTRPLAVDVELAIESCSAMNAHCTRSLHTSRCCLSMLPEASPAAEGPVAPRHARADSAPALFCLRDAHAPRHAT